MTITYEPAPDVQELATDIISGLDFNHIRRPHVTCMRSRGSKSRRTIARIYGLSKIWQKALQMPAGYVIEVISERYDRLDQEGKEKVVIHELLHIPFSFGGGFKGHSGWINDRKINRLHEILLNNRYANQTTSRYS
jgi:predicted metallopeptidase